MDNKKIELVRKFIDLINKQDLDSLINLMTPDHTFYIDGDKLLSGKENMKIAWKGYFSPFPKYKIFIDKILEKDNKVIVMGQTIGSQIPREIEKDEIVIWKAKIENDLIAT